MINFKSIDAKIANSNRKVAKEFVDGLDKKEAVEIFEHFEKDTNKMERYFCAKFGCYYMLWTPVNDKNVFISDWIVSEIIKLVVL